MSMPEFPAPSPDMTRDQALNMILSSIALEELALSHIINAEGEKIQYTLRNPIGGGCPASIPDILSVNKSVTALLEMVMQNQLLLKSKMEKVLDCLPRPQEPPCPPCLPCPPCPPCPPEPPECFQAIPGFYRTCHAIQWRQSDCSGFCADWGGCDKIPLPTGGCLSADIALEFCGLEAGERIVALELNVHCFDRPSVCQLFHGTVSQCRTVLAREMTLSVPCCTSPCYASLVIRSADNIQLKQGYISFEQA